MPALVRNDGAAYIQFSRKGRSSQFLLADIRLLHASVGGLSRRHRLSVGSYQHWANQHLRSGVASFDRVYRLIAVFLSVINDAAYHIQRNQYHARKGRDRERLLCQHLIHLLASRLFPCYRAIPTYDFWESEDPGTPPKRRSR